VKAPKSNFGAFESPGEGPLGIIKVPRRRRASGASKLRRLVEGISSGPDDSREHRREQNRSLCYDTHVSLQPVFPDGAVAELIFAGVRGGGRNWPQRN
jgi:hypothetical protein